MCVLQLYVYFKYMLLFKHSVIVTMDDNKLIKISKKYTDRSIKTWERPPHHIVSSINKILKLNKNKTLQISSRKTADLIQQDIDLDEFIKLFTRQLKQLKLPGNLNEFDYDYDYQLKRQQFLTNLYSNELTQIKALKENLRQESEKNKDITRFVKNYERLYKEELDKLGDDQEQQELVTKSNHQFLNLQHSDATSDKELEEILKQLDQQLDKIDESTSRFQQLSNEIENLITN